MVSMEPQIIARFFQQHYPHVGMTLENAKNPTQDILIAAYKAVISEIFALPDNFFTQDENDPQSTFMNIYSLVQSLIFDTTEGIYFCVGDIIMPKAQNTWKILLTLIKFLGFIQELMPQVEEIFDRKENMRMKIQQDAEEIYHLEAEINDEQEKELEIEMKIKQLQPKHAEYSEELNKLTAEKEEVKNVATKMEKDIADLEQKLSSLNESHKEAEKMNKQLSNEIVTSPQKLNSDIQRSEQEIAKIEVAIADYQEQARNLSYEIDASEEMRKKFEEFATKMRTKLKEKLVIIQQEEASKKKSEELQDEKKQEVLQAERHFSMYMAEEEEKVKQSQRKLAALKQEIEFSMTKINNVKKEVEEVKNRYESLKQERQAKICMLQAIEAKNLDVDRQYKCIEQAHSSVVSKSNELRKEYEVNFNRAEELFEQLVEVSKNQKIQELKTLLDEQMKLENKLFELQNNEN